MPFYYLQAVEYAATEAAVGWGGFRKLYNYSDPAVNSQTTFPPGRPLPNLQANSFTVFPPTILHVCTMLMCAVLVCTLLMCM